MPCRALKQISWSRNPSQRRPSRISRHVWFRPWLCHFITRGVSLSAAPCETKWNQTVTSIRQRQGTANSSSLSSSSSSCASFHLIHIQDAPQGMTRRERDEPVWSSSSSEKIQTLQNVKDMLGPCVQLHEDLKRSIHRPEAPASSCFILRAAWVTALTAALPERSPNI